MNRQLNQAAAAPPLLTFAGTSQGGGAVSAPNCQAETGTQSVRRLSNLGPPFALQTVQQLSTHNRPSMPLHPGHTQHAQHRPQHAAPGMGGTHAAAGPWGGGGKGLLAGQGGKGLAGQGGKGLSSGPQNSSHNRAWHGPQGAGGKGLAGQPTQGGKGLVCGGKGLLGVPPSFLSASQANHPPGSAAAQAQLQLLTWQLKSRGRHAEANALDVAHQDLQVGCPFL